MKKGIKIALIVGTIAVVGVAVYFIIKRKPWVKNNPENKAGFSGSDPRDPFFLNACGPEETASAFGPGRRRRKRDKWSNRLCHTCQRKGCSYPACQGAVECGC